MPNPNPESEDDPKWWLRANLYHVVTVGAAAVLALAYAGVWGVDSLLAFDEPIESLAGAYGVPDLTVVGVLLFLVVVVHELVHGVAYLLLGRLSLSEVKVGVAPYWMGVYVRPTVPLDATAYRLGIAMPGLVTGVAPAVAGIALGNPLVLAVGLYGVVITAADVAALVELRPENTGDTIQPARARC